MWQGLSEGFHGFLLEAVFVFSSQRLRPRGVELYVPAHPPIRASVRGPEHNKIYAMV